MKILIAPDSFKGSLSAAAAAEIISEAAKQCIPDAETLLAPVADGGEGTIEALLAAVGGQLREAEVCDPLGRPIRAGYAFLDNGYAVVEMARASGLPLLTPDQRDPLRATSRGTGELIARALDEGARRLLVGIGGSATNDGGMGLLRALGMEFFAEDGSKAPEGGAGLERVARIDASGLHPALEQARITVMCDVNNPLLGPSGATRVYGAQKGASEADLVRLERGMEHYARQMREYLGRDIACAPGAGAAGGVGAALGGVLGAVLTPGIDAVLDAVGFDRMLKEADLCVAGEGRIDAQSVRYGKLISGIARRCARSQVPLLVLAGGMGAGAESLFDMVDGSIMVTASGPMTLEYAMAHAPTLLKSAAERMFRLIQIGRGDRLFIDPPSI